MPPPTLNSEEPVKRWRSTHSWGALLCQVTGWDCCRVGCVQRSRSSSHPQRAERILSAISTSNPCNNGSRGHDRSSPYFNPAIDRHSSHSVSRQSPE